MVGLQRMLHAEQKPQPQNTEHFFPCSPNTVVAGPTGRANARPMARNDGLKCLYGIRHHLCQSNIRA